MEGFIGFGQIAGLLLAFSIGLACNRFKIPLPAPPEIYGSLLVLAITLGYLLMDALL